MSDTILSNLSVLDVELGRLSHGKTIVVSGGEIAEVTDCPPREEQSFIDLGGRVVMPGLIDCHVHVTAVQLNLSPTRSLPASYVVAGAARIMSDMLQRGYTTVRDAGGADRGLRMAVADQLFDGPRLFICGRAISQTGGHGDFRPQIDQPDPNAMEHFLAGGVGRIADGVPEIRRAARDEIRLGADHIKIMASGGVASAADPIDFLQYADDEISAFVDEAARAKTYVMAHAYTAAAIERCVRLGVRSIEHGNLINEKAADLMVEHDAFMVPTLTVYEALAREGKRLGFPQVSLDKLEKILEVGTRSLEIARAAGVKMAFGTDLIGEIHANQSDEFRIRSEVLSAAEIIRSATLVGAELLNMKDRLGVVKPGALADLLVVNGSPLADLSLIQNCGEGLAAIMKGGRFIKNELGQPKRSVK